MKSINKLKQDLSQNLKIDLDYYFDKFLKLKDAATEDSDLSEMIQDNIITQKQYHKFISDSIVISREISIDELFNSLLTPTEYEYPFWKSVISFIISSLKNYEKIRKFAEIQSGRTQILEKVLNTTIVERYDELPKIEGLDDDLIQEINTVLRWSIDIILLGRFSFQKYSLRAESNLGLNSNVSKEIYDLIKSNQNILTQIAIIDKIGIMSSDIDDLKEVFETYKEMNEENLE